jgi:hypothetical protein
MDDAVRQPDAMAHGVAILDIASAASRGPP